MSGYDVLVIGGGPAGSTAAGLLARAGRRVLILEREAFPREHIGESLLPATLLILEGLGVLPALQDEGFTVKRGATMRWGTADAPWSWYFSETNQRFPTSFQVWRPRFDEILLDHARACGAQVRIAHVAEVLLDDAANAANVDNVDRAPARGGEHARARGVRLADGEELLAPVVLDTSGQRALLARQLGLIEFDDFFRNLALFTYFEGGTRLPAPDEGNIYIESYEHGWSWNIPLAFGDGGRGSAPWSSVGFVMDRDRALPTLQRLGPEATYRAQVDATRDTQRMLEGARQVRPVSVLQDWSYRARTFGGDGWVLAGDAACFIDPLFSTGVHLAVTAGYLAASLVNTRLGGDTALAAAALQTYDSVYGMQYAHFHRLAQLFYSGNRTVDSYFWSARRLLGDDARFSPREGFVRAVSGQTPAGYERSVLAQGDLPPAFVASLKQIEAGRDARRDALQQRLDAGTELHPKVANGITVARQAVLGEERFEWGTVIVGAERAAPLPCSAMVVGLLRHADGRLGVGDIAGLLLPGVEGPARELLAGSLRETTGLLYLDGVLEAL